MFAYRVGFCGWKVAACLGFRLKVRVKVLWDTEAKVFVATSEDFLPAFGCVAEAATWDGLKTELNSVFDDACESVFGRFLMRPKIEAEMTFA